MKRLLILPIVLASACAGTRSVPPAVIVAHGDLSRLTCVWQGRRIVSDELSGDRKAGHRTNDFNLSIPLRLRQYDFGTYAFVDCFHGYGESLLDFNRKTSAVRAGLALVR